MKFESCLECKKRMRLLREQNGILEYICPEEHRKRVLRTKGNQLVFSLPGQRFSIAKDSLVIWDRKERTLSIQWADQSLKFSGEMAFQALGTLEKRITIERVGKI